MAKFIDIEISESEEALSSLLRKQRKLLQHSRVKALLLIKQGKVHYTTQLAIKLNRSRKTIYNWLQLYEKEGIEKYLHVRSRGLRDEKLTEHTKACLAAKLQDPYTDITSYVELLQWTKQHCQKDVPYHALYHYCHTKLKGKLKVSRKSHYKKDEQALEVFKKSYVIVKG
jgi:transposase